MSKPTINFLREYDLTDAMRRDRRSLLATVLIVFMDYQFNVIDKVLVFDVDIGRVFPIGARYTMYSILLAYFGIALASRYFGIFFSGRIYEFEQMARPLVDNAQVDFDKDEEFQAQADVEIGNDDGQEDRFEAYLTGIKDRIEAETRGIRVKYTIALATRTVLEIYLPLALGAAMIFWTIFRARG